MNTEICKKEIRRLSNILGMAVLAFFIIQEIFPYILRKAGVSDAINSDGTGYNAYSILGVAFSLLLPFLVAGGYLKRTEKIDLAPLERPKGGLLTVSVIFAGTMLALLSGQLSSYITAALEKAGILLSSPDISPPSAGAALGMYFLRIIVFAPLCEELIFRGIIMQSLKKYGVFFSVFSSALLFAALHRNLIQAPVAIISGIIMGYAVYATESLWTSMIIHILNNTAAFITGYVSFFSGAEAGGKLYFYIMTVSVILGTLGILGCIVSFSRGDLRKSLCEPSSVPFGKSIFAFLFTAPMIISLILVCVYTSLYVKIL